MVLDYVGDDKPTLAKCMRASLQFNLLAAPRLYSKLRWGSNSSCPIDIPSTITTSSITRVSPTKRENLELIRTSHLDNHVSGDCLTFRSRAARPQHIVPIAVLHYGIGEERPIKLIHIHTPLGSHCSFLPRLAPRRLVVTVTHFSGMLSIGSIDQRRLSKVIVYTYTNLKNGQLLYGDALHPQHMRPFHKSSATNNHRLHNHRNEHRCQPWSRQTHVVLLRSFGKRYLPTRIRPEYPVCRRYGAQSTSEPIRDLLLREECRPSGEKDPPHFQEGARSGQISLEDRRRQL